MKKRIVCMTLVLMMTAAQVVSVSASREDELREEQAATSAQLDATYAQIDQLYSAKQQLQNEINALDANLVNVMVSIQTLEGPWAGRFQVRSSFVMGAPALMSRAATRERRALALAGSSEG